MTSAASPTSADPRVDRLRDDFVAFNRRIRAERVGHLLTPTQLQALSHLDDSGPMTARSLAACEQVTPQAMARTVRTLEDMGMISRAADPADGRASLLELTDTGRQTLLTDRAKRNQWLTEVLSSKCTDAEREILFIAGRLMRRLATPQDAAPPTETELP